MKDPTLAGGYGATPGSIVCAGSDADTGVLHQESWLACVGDVLANGEALAKAQPIGREAWITAAYHCRTGTSISIAGFLLVDYCFT